jgi:hypothetical protein
VETETLEGELNVTLQAKDWAWLCGLLAEIRNQPDFDQMMKHDYDCAVACLVALEEAE